MQRLPRGLERFASGPCLLASQLTAEQMRWCLTHQNHRHPASWRTCLTAFRRDNGPTQTLNGLMALLFTDFVAHFDLQLPTSLRFFWLEFGHDFLRFFHISHAVCELHLCLKLLLQAHAFNLRETIARTWVVVRKLGNGKFPPPSPQ
jgi:hypothetical protein